MDFDLNLEQLQLPWPASRPEMQRTNLPRHKWGEKFLKGPVPWDWLTLAAQLPGKALHVGVALWFWAGITYSREIALSVTRLAELGVGRHAAYRALKGLEKAGLVDVQRHPGRKPIVTVLDAPKSDQ